MGSGVPWGRSKPRSTKYYIDASHSKPLILINKIKIVTGPPSEGCRQIKWDNIWAEFSSVNIDYTYPMPVSINTTCILVDAPKFLLLPTCTGLCSALPHSLWAWSLGVSKCDQDEAWEVFTRLAMLAPAALPWPWEHAKAHLLEDEN